MLSLGNAFDDEEVVGFHRPRAPLPGARSRGAHRGGRRAQDRRAFHLADLRGRPAGAGGDARRRHRGRERHRQRHDDQADPAPARRARRARPDRGARRDLSAARRFQDAQRRAGRSGGQGVRQSAQRRRRLAAPARFLHHRAPAAALLRLRLGHGQRAAGQDPVRRRRGLRALGPAAPTRSCAFATSVEEVLAYYREIGEKRADARLRHRRRRLQGQPPRLAGAAGLRLARAALGHRPQVPRRGGRPPSCSTSRSRSAAPAR